MKPLIKLKTTTLLAIPLALACFALLPRAQAQTPAETVSPLTIAELPGFNTALGFHVLDSLGAGTFNTGAGALALEDTTSGSHNTALGGQALRNNTTGSYNTAVGENALVKNLDGVQNMALGQGALANNTTGDNNTAMGFQALNVNTSNGNVGVGFQALRSNTTAGFPPNDGTNNAVGYQCLFSNTTGIDNQAFGFRALLDNVAGNFNNAVGWRALENSTGSLNTAIGDFAGGNLTTGSGNVYIGASQSGLVNESNTTYIRNVYSSVANQRDVFVNSNNKIGTVLSSRRFKEDIKPMDKASEAILALKPVTFRYKQEFDASRTPMFGLIAEEVEKVDPDLITRNDEGEAETVRYSAINVLLLNEFLKEHKKVEEQQASIAELKSTVALQQKGMEVLTAQLKEQATQMQRVSAQLEVSKPTPRTVANQ